MRKDPLRTGVVLAAVLATALLANSASADNLPQRAGAVSATPAKSYGPDFSLPKRRPDSTDPGAEYAVTEYDLSLGCIVGGVTGTGLSISAGGLNVINLIAGGLVQAASPAAAYLALGGVVFASFCAVGQAVTPAAIATYQYFIPPLRTALPSQTDARYCQASALLAPSDGGSTSRISLLRP
ncbi:hypothetical protein [Thalassobaculum sp.]|uniref:hypothetical protein n=1 Tax=Thalassobaculum sp. TaxID=2022740 RepID=UPI0032EF9763